LNKKGRAGSEDEKKAIIRRRYTYHGIILAHFIAATTYAFTTNGFGGASNGWCWFFRPVDRVAWAYVELWLSELVVIVCNLRVAFIIRRMIIILNANPQLRRDSDAFEARLVGKSPLKQKLRRWYFRLTAPFRVSNAKAYAASVRLLSDGFIFICMHIPGSVRRFAGAAKITVDPRWTIAQSVCDPFEFFAVFLVWFLFDHDVKKHWRMLFRRFLRYLCPRCVTFETESEFSSSEQSSNSTTGITSERSCATSKSSKLAEIELSVR
jgi:hypothetical protein